MENRSRITDADACIHCGLCRQNCRFLEKYQIDIGKIKEREDLIYHCFLCGKCAEVCPKGIDGREIILHMRQKQVAENGGKLKEKGYEMLVKEKQNYLFQNYRNTEKSILFPGCNFPSFFPETTKYLVELFREKTGAGVVFDCCGKPIAELGLAEQEKESIRRIEQKLQEKGVEEVIVLCPNCYAFLKPRLTVKVVSIYKKLAELGIGNQIAEKLTVFPPCPDRESRELFADIRSFLKEEPDMISQAQCCGLGGCAGGKEKELAAQMTESIREAGGGTVCTYCASCSGNFARKGFADTEHILLKILGRTERPDTAKSVLNRMKMKYWRG